MARWFDRKALSLTLEELTDAQWDRLFKYLVQSMHADVAMPRRRAEVLSQFEEARQVVEVDRSGVISTRA